MMAAKALLNCICDDFADLAAALGAPLDPSAVREAVGDGAELRSLSLAVSLMSGKVDERELEEARLSVRRLEDELRGLAGEKEELWLRYQELSSKKKGLEVATDSDRVSLAERVAELERELAGSKREVDELQEMVQILEEKSESLAAECAALKAGGGGGPAAPAGDGGAEAADSLAARVAELEAELAEAAAKLAEQDARAAALQEHAAKRGEAEESGVKEEAGGEEEEEGEKEGGREGGEGAEEGYQKWLRVSMREYDEAIRLRGEVEGRAEVLRREKERLAEENGRLLGEVQELRETLLAVEEAAAAGAYAAPAPDAPEEEAGASAEEAPPASRAAPWSAAKPPRPPGPGPSPGTPGRGRAAGRGGAGGGPQLLRTPSASLLSPVRQFRLSPARSNSALDAVASSLDQVRLAIDARVAELSQCQATLKVALAVNEEFLDGFRARARAAVKAAQTCRPADRPAKQKELLETEHQMSELLDLNRELRNKSRNVAEMRAAYERTTGSSSAPAAPSPASAPRPASPLPAQEAPSLTPAAGRSGAGRDEELSKARIAAAAAAAAAAPAPSAPARRPRPSSTRRRGGGGEEGGTEAAEAEAAAGIAALRERAARADEALARADALASEARPRPPPLAPPR
eukprot:tig00000981_g5888.t1